MFKKDNDIVISVISAQLIYIWFINSKSGNYQEIRKLAESYSISVIIIFCIKHSKFAVKKLTKFQDWDETEKRRIIEEEVDNVEKKVGNIEERVVIIEKTLKDMNDSLKFVVEKLKK